MSTKIVKLNERKVAILVEDLRLWILSQPHLNSRVDDEFLHGFLRGCQFDLSETKTRLDLYFTLKNKIPSVLSGRYVNKHILEICQMGISVFLPVSIDGEGLRLHFSKYPCLSPSVYKYTDVMKVFFMQAEINMIESRNSEKHFATVYVIDLKGASFKHSLKIDFSLSKKVLHLIEVGLPLQIKEVHFINVSGYFNCLLRMMCSFMSMDIKKKLHLHTSMDSFYKHIPQDFLPVEYGGKNGSMQTCIKQQMKNLKHYETYFENDDMYGVNEALRRNKT